MGLSSLSATSSKVGCISASVVVSVVFSQGLFINPAELGRDVVGFSDTEPSERRNEAPLVVFVGSHDTGVSSAKPSMKTVSS